MKKMKKPSSTNTKRAARKIAEVAKKFGLTVNVSRVFPKGIQRARKGTRLERSERRIGSPYCK